MKIIGTDRDGKSQHLEGRNGWSLMEVLRDADFDIAAECGGACSCATCHVYVMGGWYEKLEPISDTEKDMLDLAAAVEPSLSRLACQIICSDALDGIEVTVAPR